MRPSRVWGLHWEPHSGTPYHSFSSSDLVNGLVALMNSNVSSPVNLVSGRPGFPGAAPGPACCVAGVEGGHCCPHTNNQKLCLPQGNPEEHTILQFAQLIKTLVGE